jgi:hypothetical protein
MNRGTELESSKNGKHRQALSIRNLAQRHGKAARIRSTSTGMAMAAMAKAS